MIPEISLCISEKPVHAFKAVDVEVELFGTKTNYKMLNTL